MYFDSFSAFIYMQGHGFYVWLAYSVALLVIIGLLLAPIIQKRRFVRNFTQNLRRRRQVQHATHDLETRK